MSKKNKSFLSDLMKKQINEKATKKIKQTKVKAANSSGFAGQGSNQEVERDEESLLEEAKRESSAKAAQHHSAELIKKIVVENLVKYISMITILVITTVAVIKVGPSLMIFFKGLIHSALMLVLNG
jgi:hypothetical protein